MFYLGVLITTVADTISTALATDPQNPTTDAASGDTPELRGDLDHREVCQSSATKSICNPPPDSPSVSGQSLGQRTMWPLHVDITITDTPSSEENGHDAAASGSAELVVAIDEADTAEDPLALHGDTPADAAINNCSGLAGETTETDAEDSFELHGDIPEDAAINNPSGLAGETNETDAEDSFELRGDIPEDAAINNPSGLAGETNETDAEDSFELRGDIPEDTAINNTSGLAGETNETDAEDSFELRGDIPEDAAISNTYGLPGETTETAVIDDTNEPPVSNSDITALSGTNHEETGAMSSNDSLVPYDTDTDTDTDTEPDTATSPLITSPSPSAPPRSPAPYFHSAPYYFHTNPPNYEFLYPQGALVEAANNFDPSEANGMNKSPIPDYPEGASAWPPVTEKPISPEEFNDTYYDALKYGDLYTIKRLGQDYPQLMIDPLTHPEEPKKSFHPLHVAATFNQIEALEFLCENPYIDINALSSFKMTALHHAINKNNVAAVKFLCQRQDINVDLENAFGSTPIILACKKNVDGQIIDELLAHNPYLGENTNSKIALSFSVENNNFETTKKLLESGAKVNTKHKDGKDSIFYISFDKASDEISKLLLRYLRDVNQPLSDCNARALHLASLKSKADIADYLVNTRNASRFVTNKYKSMPVHYAAFAGDETIFRKLIDLGCTLDEERGKIEEDFWDMEKNPKKFKKHRNMLIRQGGTPSDFFRYRGDIEQIRNHEAKYNRSKKSIKLEKENDKKKMQNMQEHLKEQEALEIKKRDQARKLERLKLQIGRFEEQNKKTTDTDAATGVTLSTPSTPEQPAPDSDLSALAYTHQSGHKAMQNEWTRYDVNDSRLPPMTPFTNMDDVPGASAIPAIMKEQLDDKTFKKKYLNAIQAGDIDTLRYLKQVRPESMIDSLKDPKDPDAYIHPLHLAALNNQWTALTFLCELDGININTRMSNGQTVLNLAVRKKKEDIILFLCRQPHINVDLSDDSTKHTPIISACELNLSDQVIEALLAHKPSLEPNNNQKTALGFSVENHNITITKKLLEAGADVGRIVEDGKNSVFYIAFQDGTEEMSKLLLSYLPDIDKAVTKNGARVLQLASLLGKKTLIKHLISDCEASRFIENNSHAMPVHYAAHHDHSETLRELLKQGCSMNEGPGKIEDDFWRKNNDGFYSFLAGNVPPTVDYESYNKPNATHLHFHGGTPSEYYGKLDINQLNNIEKQLNFDNKEEKMKDKVRMENRQKQKRKKQKQLKKEKVKETKENKELEKLNKQLEELQKKELELQKKVQNQNEPKKLKMPKIFGAIWKK
ncbi:ankyrin repeat domain-containing protein [Thalassotalea sp. G20_0]|uniref:ankyrin repeat domain-containing protein n=1 Tax=Thalassotalea sp. G20_0 TaxID=2821093 RepID=UPI001AD9C049|nr:ankyrin repeat domain-containing protein [Thalassotalea sp. G20_0]MBO9494497.1 ankyrin repeat domain-containing protein [Thalassotalea sp. G20_0]